MTITSEERRKLTREPYCGTRELAGRVHDRVSDRERRDIVTALRNIPFFEDDETGEERCEINDLIDRPTCSMEYMPEYSGDEIYPTEAYRCSECGWIASEGKPTYCPCCGAEVLDEDGAN